MSPDPFPLLRAGSGDETKSMETRLLTQQNVVHVIVSDPLVYGGHNKHAGVAVGRPLIVFFPTSKRLHRYVFA